jgi:hypothetical protein
LLMKSAEYVTQRNGAVLTITNPCQASITKSIDKSHVFGYTLHCGRCCVIAPRPLRRALFNTVAISDRAIAQTKNRPEK